MYHCNLFLDLNCNDTEIVFFNVSCSIKLKFCCWKQKKHGRETTQEWILLRNTQSFNFFKRLPISFLDCVDWHWQPNSKRIKFGCFKISKNYFFFQSLTEIFFQWNKSEAQPGLKNPARLRKSRRTRFKRN